MDTNIEPITADWNVHDEAKFFANLVEQGEMTDDQVEAHIRMSGKDALYLRTVISDVTSPKLIEQLRNRREQTWEAFQRLRGIQ